MPQLGRKKEFKIGNRKILPGERTVVHLAVAKLYDFTDVSISVEVVRGEQPGPTLFVSSTIHGDEINGVEIIRRLLTKKSLDQIRGTLIAVPIVNVFGFINKSRYLPDRRDLNRSFPGSTKGPLASRIASLFMKEIVSKSTHGIDLHTGAIHRSNLPQIRACMDVPAVKRLATAFGAPVAINSKTRDGSLREATRRRGIPILLYEGGEALRYDEQAIRIGVNGCLNVMRSIGMIATKKTDLPRKTFIAKDSHWVRAPNSGSMHTQVTLGQEIQKGDEIAVVYDPFGRKRFPVHSEVSGIVIGKVELPLLNKGDAMFHIATSRQAIPKSRRLESIYPELYSSD